MLRLLQDIRYAVRQLRRAPGFTLAAVLTLALGIGANTAIFSVVNAVLLRPLPYLEPERLVQLWSSGIQRGRFSLSYPDVRDMRAQPQLFTHVAAFTEQRFNLTGHGEAREVAASLASADLFPLLGVKPALGQSFTAAEEREPLVVLSHALWLSVYGGDPGIVGQSVTLDGKGYSVIGVMPAGFQFPDDQTELWVPIGAAFLADAQLETNRGYHAFNAVARLAPRVTAERVRGDLAVLAHRIDAELRSAPDGRRELRMQGGQPPGPGALGGRGPGELETAFLARPLTEEVVGDVRPTLFILSGTVALVLLIACANAANLLIARANARQREIAIRQALGAGRGQIARQILIECVVLSLVAGAAGLLLSLWGLQLLFATWPGSLPRVHEVGIDRWVLGFTFLVSLLTGVGFGALPAFRASAPGIERALREESPGGGRRRRRAQRVLVTAQLAVALVLLIGAGLLVRSFIRLLNVDPGYDIHHVLAARIRLTPSRYADPQSQSEFFDNLQETLRQRPGVKSVAVSRTLPLSGAIMMLGLDLRRIRPDDTEPFLPVGFNIVGADYFPTLAIRLLNGRLFAAADRDDAPRVAIVNTRLAKRLWPDVDPVGQRLPLNFPALGAVEATVVGVIGDIHYSGLQDEPQPELYLPATQMKNRDEQMWLLLRADQNPLTLTTALREAVKRADAEQPVAEIVSLEQLVQYSTAARRFSMTLISLFGSVAAVLALIGVYGVTAYAVHQRTRELGIRIALGAQREDVVRLVLWEGLGLALLGLAAGALMALGLTRVLASMLFGVTPTDLFTFLAAALLLGGAVLLAAYLPARRAASVDPMIALRAE